MTGATDQQLLDTHDRHVRTVAEAVFGMVERFAGQGLTPVAVFEGAIRGGVLAMVVRGGDAPADVAACLDEISDRVRILEPAAFTGACH